MRLEYNGEWIDVPRGNWLVRHRPGDEYGPIMEFFRPGCFQKPAYTAQGDRGCLIVVMEWMPVGARCTLVMEDSRVILNATATRDGCWHEEGTP